MRQHVTEQTHVAGHILDFLITSDTDSTVSNVEISDSGRPITETRLVITSLLYLMLVCQNHHQYEKL
jgi:hypothetical protein